MKAREYLKSKIVEWGNNSERVELRTALRAIKKAEYEQFERYFLEGTGLNNAVKEALKEQAKQIFERFEKHRIRNELLDKTYFHFSVEQFDEIKSEFLKVKP